MLCVLSFFSNLTTQTSFSSITQPLWPNTCFPSSLLLRIMSTWLCCRDMIIVMLMASLCILQIPSLFSPILVKSYRDKNISLYHFLLWYKFYNFSFPHLLMPASFILIGDNLSLFFFWLLSDWQSNTESSAIVSWINRAQIIFTTLKIDKFMTFTMAKLVKWCGYDTWLRQHHLITTLDSRCFSLTLKMVAFSLTILGLL